MFYFQERSQTKLTRNDIHSNIHIETNQILNDSLVKYSKMVLKINKLKLERRLNAKSCEEYFDIAATL